MRAYLIDPYDQTLTEVTVESGVRALKSIRDLTGATTLDHCYINAQRDQLWVSDTGLCDGLPRFGLTTGRLTGAGKAVVIGCDEWSESCDPTVTLDELTKMVTW